MGKRTQKMIVMEKILHSLRNCKKFLALFFLCLIGCVSSNATNYYTLGKEFKIVLDGEGDGGFSWQLIEDSEIILIDTLEVDREKENGLFEYSKVFILKSLKPGVFKLKFKKARSFQPELILEEHLKEITVEIKK